MKLVADLAPGWFPRPTGGGIYRRREIGPEAWFELGEAR